MKYFAVAVVVFLLSACQQVSDGLDKVSPYAAIYNAQKYAAFCKGLSLEQRKSFRDQMQAELSRIDPALVAPKFDCNNNGVPDLEE